MPDLEPQTVPACRQHPRRPSGPAAKLGEPSVDGPQRVRLALAPARACRLTSGVRLATLAVFVRRVAVVAGGHRVIIFGFSPQSLKARRWPWLSVWPGQRPGRVATGKMRRWAGWRDSAWSCTGV